MYFASVKLEEPPTYSVVEYYLAIWSLRSTLGWWYVDRHYESGLGDEFCRGFCASYQMANTAEQVSWLHLLEEGGGTGGVGAREKTGRRRVGGRCAKRVGNGGSKEKLHKKCFIFRNRKGAKGLKGGGRECKVRMAEGLDPLSPPPEQITIVCFPRFVPSLFVPKDQVYPVV